MKDLVLVRLTTSPSLDELVKVIGFIGDSVELKFIDRARKFYLPLDDLESLRERSAEDITSIQKIDRRLRLRQWRSKKLISPDWLWYG